MPKIARQSVLLGRRAPSLTMVNDIRETIGRRHKRLERPLANHVAAAIRSARLGMLKRRRNGRLIDKLGWT